MTHEQVLAAVEKYEALVRKQASEPKRFFLSGLLPSKQDCLAHVLYMIPELRKHLSSDKAEKAMRWLGFIQGVLWVTGLVSIEEMKDDNR